MAVDQTEAMIAAIKAQLEKERAAEAAKKKREEEEELLKSGSKKKDAESCLLSCEDDLNIILLR